MKRRVTLKRESESDTALIKKEIQRLAREVVIKRDGGCIFSDQRGHHIDIPKVENYSKDTVIFGGDTLPLGEVATFIVPPCNGYAKDGHLILQADHLVSRSNSATYADTRLIVCVCRGHHGWKSVGGNLRKKRYDAIVRQLISPERVALWDKMEASSWKPTKVVWALELAALKQELARMGDRGSV